MMLIVEPFGGTLADKGILQSVSYPKEELMDTLGSYIATILWPPNAMQPSCPQSRAVTILLQPTLVKDTSTAILNKQHALRSCD